MGIPHNYVYFILCISNKTRLSAGNHRPTPPNNCRSSRIMHTKCASGRQKPRISFGNYEFPIDKPHTFCYNRLAKQKTAYRAPYQRKEKTQ